jgi:GNAT superfamily N-acetyltransferase
MSGIRALVRDDLPAVCALYEQVMTGEERHTADPRLVAYFGRVFLDDPWNDPELPSLVHEAPDVGIVGFIGSNTRRMRLDDRPLRMVCSSNLVVHPDWRSRGVGALLQRRLLNGPQDLTIADRANEESRTMWLVLGGQEMVGDSVGWYRVLRPGALVGALASRTSTSAPVAVPAARRALATGARVLARPLDALAGRVRPLEPRDPEGTRAPLAVDDLRELVGTLGARVRLHPDYDAAFLRWVSAELDALRHLGRVTARRVSDERGRLQGWFLYLLVPGGVAQVLQVGVTGDGEAVIDHLLRQAWSDGAAGVLGRLEPALTGVLDRPGVVLRRSARALVHSSDPELLALLGSPRALLSHLDGEWLVSHARRL